ncbi:MAG: HIT domain-containing protein [Candidatus Woesearchaeota archaeon]
MELSEEHKRIIEEQKKQCPFCKILKGEIPSKTLFTDDQVSALLDINPLTDGHTLLVPKNHYPILPFIPDKTQQYLFNAAINLSESIKLGMMKSGTTIFIANGAAAGQQSTHFLIHLIPRDSQTHRPFNLEEKEIDQEYFQDTYVMLKERLRSALSNEAKQYPLEEQEQQQTLQEEGSEENTLVKMMKEQVLRIIEENPELKQLILLEPEMVKKNIPHHPQLSKMFKRIAFDEIYALLKKREEEALLRKPKGNEKEKSTEKTAKRQTSSLDEHLEDDLA